MSLTDNPALASEQIGIPYIPAEPLIDLGAVRSRLIDVKSNQDLVRQSLEAPGDQVLEDLPWHVDGCRVCVSVFERGAVVSHHRIDQPLLDQTVHPCVGRPNRGHADKRSSSVSGKEGGAVAKKKGGLGRFIGAITGSPYERLMKQLEKISTELENDEGKLARELKKFSRLVQKQFEEENIDAEEHDLLMEEVEEVDPQGRKFPKLNDDSEDFFDGSMPDAPRLKGGRSVDLDDLMRSKTDSFTSSYGKEEFEEFRQKMTDDFYQESDEAIQAGDHQAEIRTEHRTFGSAEEDAENVKRLISEESGIPNPSAAQDDDYRVDEDGTEWWRDDDGYWWFRGPGEADWQPFD